MFRRTQRGVGFSYDRFVFNGLVPVVCADVSAVINGVLELESIGTGSLLISASTGLAVKL